jgi:hypothetical protein
MTAQNDRRGSADVRRRADLGLGQRPNSNTTQFIFTFGIGSRRRFDSEGPLPTRRPHLLRNPGVPRLHCVSTTYITYDPTLPARDHLMTLEDHGMTMTIIDKGDMVKMIRRVWISCLVGVRA